MAGVIEVTQIKTIDLEGAEISNSQDGIATVKCDGPNCQGADSICTGVISWKLPKSETEADQIPDDVYRILRLGVGVSGKLMTFFGRNCLKEFMRVFTPPESPRERKAQEEANKEAEPAEAA